MAVARRFGGVMGPMVTPFRADESVDLDGFASNVRAHMAAGLDGVLVAGSTVAAQNPVDFLLARFHPDGALDTSFGSSGFLKTDFNAGSSDGCNSVALAGPDLFLAAGSTTPPPLGDFALARYIASTPVELLAFEVE